MSTLAKKKPTALAKSIEALCAPIVRNTESFTAAMSEQIATAGQPELGDVRSAMEGIWEGVHALEDEYGMSMEDPDVAACIDDEERAINAAWGKAYGEIFPLTTAYGVAVGVSNTDFGNGWAGKDIGVWAERVHLEMCGWGESTAYLSELAAAVPAEEPSVLSGPLGRCEVYDLKDFIHGSAHVDNLAWRANQEVPSWLKFDFYMDWLDVEGEVDELDNGSLF